ncbi:MULTISPECIES: hypothetical protein [Allobacillus]|uniref:Uncharacterized protein n=1 Tax=Allobacillus salarius TaxID=1955272 RepID=A0A556PDI0_9BACI|nr:hypothetical protein [Allobacillus salarius]TSJ62439.1 hypothetical protein FPQ13_10160 [Allobacillus salarius]
MFLDRQYQYDEGIDRMMNEGGVFHPDVLNELNVQAHLVEYKYIYDEGIDRLVNEGGLYIPIIQERNEWFVEPKELVLAENEL